MPYGDYQPWQGTIPPWPVWYPVPPAPYYPSPWEYVPPFHRCPCCPCHTQVTIATNNTSPAQIEDD